MLDLVLDSVVVNDRAIKLLFFSAGQFSLVDVIVPILPDCLALLRHLLPGGVSSLNSVGVHLSIETND